MVLPVAGVIMALAMLHAQTLSEPSVLVATRNLALAGPALGCPDRTGLTAIRVQDILIVDPQPKWRNGRRAGLKIRWGNTRVGSSPTFGISDSR